MDYPTTYGGFADAMRAGAQRRPQAFNTEFRLEGTVWTSCAHGAMVEVLEPAYAQAVFQESTKDVPFHHLHSPLLDYEVPCPAEDCDLALDVQSIITHLNDEHLWTREQIADWLASLDDREEGEWR